VVEVASQARGISIGLSRLNLSRLKRTLGPDAPNSKRADRIGEFWGNPKTRTFAEPLIDCEEDRR
jgi:hypothetical protein